MEHPLRLYRTKHGLSLEAVARMVGAAKSTISRIETGDQTPSVGLIKRITAATNGALKPNDFFRDEAA